MTSKTLYLSLSGLNFRALAIKLFVIFILLSQQACVLKWGVNYLKDQALVCDQVQDIYYYPSSLYNEEYFSQTRKVNISAFLKMAIMRKKTGNLVA